MEDLKKKVEVNPEFFNWTYNDPRTYVLLREGTNIGHFNEKIKDFLQKKVDSNSPALFIIGL